MPTTCFPSHTESIRFLHTVILPKRHKINIFHIHQLSDILKVDAERIICGNPDNKRSAVSQMSLCREKDRCVHYAVLQALPLCCRCMGKSPSRQTAFPGRHALPPAVSDALIPCDFGDSMHKVSRLSKARVHHLCIIGIYSVTCVKLSTSRFATSLVFSKLQKEPVIPIPTVQSEITISPPSYLFFHTVIKYFCTGFRTVYARKTERMRTVYLIPLTGLKITAAWS